MTNHDATLTSVAAWGASEGITRQAAHTAVRRCGIPLQDGRVDPAVASALYRQRTRPRVRTKAPATAAPEPGQPAPEISYQEARRRQAVADMLMAEREAARQARELVRVEDVIRLWGNQLTICRERLLNIPNRIAPTLPQEHVRQVFEALTVEIHDALTELSRTDGVPAAEAEK
ncbi:MAG: hypothetical protein KA431_14970 [Rubrivivax sp.]|jgi:hypothetical protein|nr:hypothetical protein [Rubrivivax sp.]